MDKGHEFVPPKDHVEQRTQSYQGRDIMLQASATNSADASRPPALGLLASAQALILKLRLKGMPPKPQT